MPVIALFTMGFPYLLFFLIIQFGHISTPPYTYRICFMFISFSQGVSMLLCLINTDDVQKCLINGFRKMKRRRRPPPPRRRVLGVSVINHPIRLVPVQVI